MKITIELDTSSPEDCQAFSRLLPLLEREPTIMTINEVAAGMVPPAVEEAAERGKAMTKAAKALRTAVGGPRLTAKQIGKLAADARWAKSRAEKAGKPAPAKAKPQKPAPRPAKAPPGPPEPKPHDYSRATEEPLSGFAEAPGEAMATLMGGAHTPYPDGRELMLGTFTQPPPQEDDHVRAIDQIARDAGAHPSG